MQKSWVDVLNFPVTIEGREDTIVPWIPIFQAETREIFEFRINSFKFPVYPYMRIRTADGETFEVSQESLLDFNEKAAAETKRKTEPLKAFLTSAPEAALETARELVQAGLAARRFLIAPNSRVTLHHPNLHAILMHEFEDSVVCKILVDDSPITETEPAVTLWHDIEKGFGITPDSLDAEVSAFLILLCASIVRDFWVIEERTRGRVYQKRTEKKRERQGTGKDRKLIVEKTYIFLPRFRYTLDSNLSQSKISHEVRVRLSPHLVSGHLRKLHEGHKSSEAALERAAEFGINVADGYTFVRPHKKGEIEQMRTYRSRSAFELIFSENLEKEN